MIIRKVFKAYHPTLGWSEEFCMGTDPIWPGKENTPRAKELIGNVVQYIGVDSIYENDVVLATSDNGKSIKILASFKAYHKLNGLNKKFGLKILGSLLEKPELNSWFATKNWINEMFSKMYDADEVLSKRTDMEKVREICVLIHKKIEDLMFNEDWESCDLILEHFKYLPYKDVIMSIVTATFPKKSKMKNRSEFVEISKDNLDGVLTDVMENLT